MLNCSILKPGLELWFYKFSVPWFLHLLSGVGNLQPPESILVSGLSEKTHRESLAHSGTLGGLSCTLPADHSLGSCV